MSDDMCKDEELGVIWGNHPHASSSQRAAFRKAVSDKKDSAFAYDVSKLGTYKGAVGSYDIPLLHRYPIMAKRRRKSPLETQIQEEKCEELKKVGLIIPAPTNCQYASECVLPVKKDADGNYTDRRFCVDYREINSATEADKYGLHRPEQIFGDIKGHGFFTKMDLRAGFHQIEVKKEDQPKTAFWWKNQIYMYTRMPFGLRNATAHFKGLWIMKFVKQVYRRTALRL